MFYKVCRTVRYGVTVPTISQLWELKTGFFSAVDLRTIKETFAINQMHFFKQATVSKLQFNFFECKVFLIKLNQEQLIENQYVRRTKLEICKM